MYTLQNIITITNYCYSQQSNLAIIFNCICDSKSEITTKHKCKALNELSHNLYTQKSHAHYKQMTKAEKKINCIKLANAQHAHY